MSVFKEELVIIGSGIMGYFIVLFVFIVGFNVKIWGIDDNDIYCGK